MAINISYDPSDDPEAIAAREAEEADSLQVGEQMMNDQQDLLAGKYRNAEELEKAYMELQQRFSKGDAQAESEEEPAEVAEESESYDYDRYDEEGDVNFEAVKEAYGDKLADVFQEAGIDPWVMNDHFVENGGTLTNEMYDQLNEAGFSDTVIDAYLGGLRAQAGQVDQVEAPILNDSEILEIKNLAGGEKGYEQVTQWAEENLSQADIEAFDEVINTGNKAAVRFAVKALVSQFEDAMGRDADLVTGKSTTKGAPYRSMAEVVRDMQDPRYERDEAYRMDVMQKLERSNLKV
jgi:hypothetical protein